METPEFSLAPSVSCFVVLFQVPQVDYRWWLLIVGGGVSVIQISFVLYPLPRLKFDVQSIRIYRATCPLIWQIFWLCRNPFPWGFWVRKQIDTVVVVFLFAPESLNSDPRILAPFLWLSDTYAFWLTQFVRIAWIALRCGFFWFLMGFVSSCFYSQRNWCNHGKHKWNPVYQ